MSEYSTNQTGNCDGVPIKVNRVYDSCSDKDCLSNLQVTLTDGTLPENISIVKSRCVTVENVCITVEAVPFNKGFYSVDLTFTFNLEILGYERACSTPTVFSGTAIASKNCILYGSESATRTFFSDGTATHGATDDCCTIVNLPTASVSLVEPIVLETRVDLPCRCDEQPPAEQRTIYVTLGMFSVVELTRPVTIMVPSLEYTIPRKECCAEADSPCEVFERLKFPEDEFSPITLTDSIGGCGCSGISRGECEHCRDSRLMGNIE